MSERIADGSTSADVVFRAPTGEAGSVTVLGGSATGTNISAGSAVVSAGASTGTGTSDLVLKACVAGSSGSSSNTPATFLTCSGANNRVELTKTLYSTADIRFSNSSYVVPSGNDIYVGGLIASSGNNTPGGNVIIAGGDSTGAAYSLLRMYAAVPGASGSTVRVAEPFLDIGGGNARITAYHQIDGTTAHFTGTVDAPTFSGNLSGNVSGSISGGTVSGTSISGGNISGTTGHFTGTVDAPLFSGPLSGNMSNGSVSATTGTFSSTLGLQGNFSITKSLPSIVIADTGGGAKSWEMYSNNTTVFFQCKASPDRVIWEANQTTFDLKTATVGGFIVGNASYLGSGLFATQGTLLVEKNAHLNETAYVWSTSQGALNVIERNDSLSGDYTYISFYRGNDGSTHVSDLKRLGATNGMGFSAVSDQRLKTNIANTDIDALAIINSIPMRKYDRTDIPLHVDLGYVAQECYAVCPAMVCAAQTENDTWGVVPTELIPYLTRAIQQLSTRVSALENP